MLSIKGGGRIPFEGPTDDARISSKVKSFPYLMRSTDEVKVMTIEKFRYNIGPEGKRYAAIILAPSLHVLVGI